MRLSWDRFKLLILLAALVVIFLLFNIFYNIPHVDNKICQGYGYDKSMERQYVNETFWLHCYRNNDTMSEWMRV